MNITVDTSTSPSLSQLTGTIFAIVGVTSKPTVTSAATTTFTVGSAGTFSVTTAGFPTPALTFTGTLPSGVTLVDNGNGTATLSGTPAAGTAKSYTLKITAKNSAGSVVQTFSLVVNQAPAVTSAATASFTIGKSGTFKVTSTGSPAAALSFAEPLPAGLSFVDNGNGKGTLSGTPAVGTSGTYSLFISASSTAGSVSQPFTLVVNQVPTVTSAATTTFTVGSAGTFTVTTAGFPTPALTFTGTLPSGVTLVDNGNGTATLSGTPAAGTAKSYTLKITAKNSAGSVVQTFSLVVNQAPAVTSAATAVVHHWQVRHLQGHKHRLPGGGPELRPNRCPPDCPSSTTGTERERCRARRRSGRAEPIRSSSARAARPDQSVSPSRSW